MELEKVILVNNFISEDQEHDEQTNTDVIVHLTNGRKFIASFTTFKKIESQRLQHVKNQDYLGGKYFWEKNMFLIDSCNETNIKLVIEKLLEEGDFKYVFEEI